MSVAQINGWRQAGCGDLCWPRRHDPVAHEEYGRLLERKAPQYQRIVKTGALTIDLLCRTVAIHGTEVHVTVREWELLEYLARRSGRWCSNQEILHGVWGPEWTGSHLVNVNCNRLRGRLGDAGCFIETDRRSGNGRRRLRIAEPES